MDPHTESDQNQETIPDRRVALVTGAARGIGAAVAQRLAADGFDVAALDLDADACADTVAAVEATGRLGYAVAADVADETAVNRAVATVAEDFGPPLALVSSAGILRDRTIAKMTVQEWDQVLGVHLRGAFLTSRATVPYMREAQWGRIVCMSSISAQGNIGQVNYSAAKAGLQGLVKTLAMELGRHHITANAVAPGYTATEMTRAMAAKIGIGFEEMMAGLAADIPAGRVGRPHDIAHAVSFFCDPRSSFTSGQVLYVAGGPYD